MNNLGCTGIIAMNKKFLLNILTALSTIYAVEVKSSEVTVAHDRCDEAWCVSAAEFDKFAGRSMCKMRIDNKANNDKYNFVIIISRGDEVARQLGLGNKPNMEFLVNMNNVTGTQSQLDYINLEAMQNYLGAGYKIDSGEFVVLPPTKFIGYKVVWN